MEISDRDYIRKNKLNFLNNKGASFDNFMLETFKNYNPDFIFFGHTKNIPIELLENFRLLNKNLIISQWNEDPVMKNLEYSKNNIENIRKYSDYVDHNFLTTDPSVLLKQKIKIKNPHFFFVPVDKNIECFDVYNLNTSKDLFYAMSHGVNRATLKKGKTDNRINFLNRLIENISGVNYDFYGFENREPIWGNNFYKELIKSKMGLNLSRGKPVKYYSSNRIASLMGNGLLTYVDHGTQLSDIFNSNEMITYKDIGDLAEKIIFYNQKNSIRKKIAKNGQKKYFKLFNEVKTANYIIDQSFGKNTKLF